MSALLTAAVACLVALRTQAARRRAAADVTDRYVPLSQETIRALARGYGEVRSELSALAFEALQQGTALPVSVYHLADLLGFEDSAHIETAASHLEVWARAQAKAAGLPLCETCFDGPAAFAACPACVGIGHLIPEPPTPPSDAVAGIHAQRIASWWALSEDERQRRTRANTGIPHLRLVHCPDCGAQKREPCRSPS